MEESIYKSYSPDQLEELQSNFLINSWSYSKVSSFSRNEKAFEMVSIYGIREKRSSSSIAGNAYHAALQNFFLEYRQGRVLDIVDLEVIAFEYIDNVKANEWKLQKTTPTVADCVKKATTTASALLKNFLKESSIYLDEIYEIIEVEVYVDEFLVINGVDIPLPCHALIDLVARKKDGSVVVIDHKSKSVFTTEEEMALFIGIQAITYIKCYESKFQENVNEVWFVENKYSQNKDGSPQLNKFKVVLNEDTRKLYESLLYEPLKRMVEAVNDPDYIYLINNNDNFTDRAELYDFWAKTQISEIEDFNVPEAKKDLVERRMKKIRDSSIASINPKIIKEFKKNASQFIQYDLSSKDMTQEEKIEQSLRSFGITVRVAHRFLGYSSDTFLLEVSAGVKVGNIQSHKLDIANALDVANVRISNNLVMHEGKSYLSIEFSKKRENTLEFNPNDLFGYKIPIGKDNMGNVIVWDLDNHSTPHMLIGGATGSGKSVCIMSTINYAIEAGINEIYIMDPKMEFEGYENGSSIQVFNEIDDIEAMMELLVEQMNDKVRKKDSSKVLIVFDEFADAVASAGKKSNLEGNLKRLLQKGRSTGFRILAATQRASVKVITGDAKVNFPVQVCFRVPKEIDSKVMIDEGGAESLAGYGDGLIKSPEYLDTVRFQGYYFSNNPIAVAS